MRSVSSPRSALLLAAISVAVVVGIFVHGGDSSPNSVRAASVKPDKDRHEAPDFSLKDADGKTVQLADYKGKVVLLNFWATWCGPCRLEIPWFMDMQRQNKDKGFEVLGVAMDDEGWEAVKPFLAELKVNYRVVIGDDSTTRKYGGVDALPTTFLIDRGGKIAAVHVGLASRKEYEEDVNELVQSPAPGSGAIVPQPGFLVAPIRR
jgi:peroxiredoxin